MGIDRLIGSKNAVACIGSRRINAADGALLMRLGACLALSGRKIRSGHADGADYCFETGARIALSACRERYRNPDLVDGMCLEIFLPWAGFSGATPDPAKGFLVKNNAASFQMAAKFHPAFANLRSAERELMARNSMQVLGSNLASPASFVLAITDDGACSTKEVTRKTGGTGQALRIASAHGVPIYNLRRVDHRDMALDWIEQFRKKSLGRLGIDPCVLVDDFLRLHAQHPVIEGDLLRGASEGAVDVLIHGANIHCTMGSGFAKGLREQFSEAFRSDLQTSKGDIKKMGSFSECKVVRNGHSVRIFNAYVQAGYGRDESKVYVDYGAVRKSMKAIARTLPNGARIGYPKIGAGLANGDWVTLSRIIRSELNGFEHRLFWLPGMEQKRVRAPSEVSSQSSFDP